MAKREHLARIKKGVKTWNNWRTANPEVVPDLSRAKLFRAKLPFVNLTMANLAGADLSEADLSEADLRYANLSLADLSGVDLSEADLTGGDLSWTDLSWADLSGAGLSTADLGRSSLFGAGLYRADFTGATIGYTVFGNNDLSGVKGLETMQHKAPSTIGIDTIYKSKGKIPLAFLRGAGVPDNFIEYMGSLTGGALEFYSCFISYSTKDQDFADRLHADLQNKGVRCWFAPHDLKIGDRFQEKIEESIRIYDKLLIILSRESVTSDWVEREVQAALEKERRPPKNTVLFPIRLDDAVMECDKAWAADIRRRRHIGDFRKWKEHDSLMKALERLLRDLKTEAPKTVKAKG